MKRSNVRNGSENENNIINPNAITRGKAAQGKTFQSNRGNHRDFLQQQTSNYIKINNFEGNYEDENASIRKSTGFRDGKSIGMNRLNVSGSIDGNETEHDFNHAGYIDSHENYEAMMHSIRRSRGSDFGDSEGSIEANRTNDSGDHERNKMRHNNGGSDDDQSVVEIETIQCDCCKRSFAPKVYEKHFDSDGKPKCENSMKKKRPVFNSAKVCSWPWRYCLISILDIG